jgi:hypothetical protein
VPENNDGAEHVGRSYTPMVKICQEKSMILKAIFEILLFAFLIGADLPYHFPSCQRDW